MSKNKVWGAPGGGIYHTYILSLQRLISGEKRSNLTWNGPVYHSYIGSQHFIHQSLLWCLISLVTQERPALHIIKDWWDVLVKDRGVERGLVGRGNFELPSAFSEVLTVGCVAFYAQYKHYHCGWQMLCQASLLATLRPDPKIWGDLQMQLFEVNALTPDDSRWLRRLKTKGLSLQSPPSSSSSPVTRDNTNWQNKQTDYPKSFFLEHTTSPSLIHCSLSSYPFLVQSACLIINWLIS